MSDLTLAVEHFSSAVAALAIGEGSRRERLAEAWLSLIALEAHDIPDPLREQFRELERGWLEGDVDGLDDAETERAMRGILVVHAELLTLLPPATG